MSSASRAWVLGAALVALAVLGAVLLAASVTRPSGFTLNLIGVSPVAQLDRGEAVCQAPIDVVEGFDRIVLGTYVAAGERARTALRVDVERGGRPVASGRVEGRLPVNSTHSVSVGEVGREGGPIRVCVRSSGTRRVGIYGSTGAASVAIQDGRRLESDLALSFLGPERSLLAQVSAVLERAALFRGGTGPALLWALLALTVLGAPLLLVLALRAAARDAV